jgi:DNA replication and repair protein RecF
VTNGREQLIEIEIPPPRRDRIQVNRQRLPRADELLEALRVTVFSPDDLVLVKGGPDERRSFIDDVIELLTPTYGSTRRDLERVLRQRNALLRQVAGRLSNDEELTLAVWDHKLATIGAVVLHRRTQLVELLGRPAADAFRRLTGLSGTLVLGYQSSVSGDLAAAIAAARRDDLRKGFTTVGPHRDELWIAFDDLDARTRLSQGRQRAVVLALRLAAHEVVTEATGTAPLLLLDDAFSELDPTTADGLAGELPSGQALATTAGALPEAVSIASIRRLEAGKLLQ